MWSFYQRDAQTLDYMQLYSQVEIMNEATDFEVEEESVESVAYFFRADETKN